MARLIPETTQSPVVRTDFSNSAAWEAVCAEIVRPVGEFQAYVTFVDDVAFDGLTPAQIRSAIPTDSTHAFLFVVDRITLQNIEHPILVLEVRTTSTRTFRVVPSSMWSVENNLSIANLDFDDFVDSVDADGIFRGFPT